MIGGYKMRVKSLGKNITEIQTDRGYILVSYETPVACVLSTKTTITYKTDEFHSITTSRHINQWFKDMGYNPDYITTQPQYYFDQLLNM